MGVSGCGKTTIGRRLAERLGWPFYDGDDFHPPENKAKMGRGVPLTDEDRAGWLSTLADLLRRESAAGRSAVLACSALKHQYRERLRVSSEVNFVHLRGSYDLILGRLQSRQGHYMKPEMLTSQFATLEAPADALTLDIAAPPEQLVERILGTLIEQKESPMTQCDLGLIGLAVMGQNLVLNMNDHGFKIAVFNRSVAKVDEFLQGPARGTAVVGAHSLEELVGLLKRPRRVMLMVKAGPPVDDFIELLLPLLEPGDIVIDGGNSNYEDSLRRAAYLESKGLLYVGTGVSGGEEGARHGPSIMPGGSPAAWPHVKDIFQAIAAKVEDGTPCCEWVGENGAGHFVKMVHNGIEYGDMQLIAEAYQLLRTLVGLTDAEAAPVFAEWDRGPLNSYLIEITGQILAVQDADGQPLVGKILDVAGQKGTGRWTVMAALEAGMPLTLISEAVLARSLSALKDERVAAEKILSGPAVSVATDRAAWLPAIRDALYAAKIISYAQGFMLMRAVAREHGWNLNYGGIALMWRGGCIIRSAFLGKIKEAYAADPHLSNLLLAPYFRHEIQAVQPAWRRVVARAVENGVPVPAMASALTFFDGYRAGWLPASLIQAQRDYFGAHTYERVDQPRGQFFHTNWTGLGGSVTASSYSA